jgi:hypothetical protein
MNIKYSNTFSLVKICFVFQKKIFCIETYTYSILYLFLIILKKCPRTVVDTDNI